MFLFVLLFNYLYKLISLTSGEIGFDCDKQAGYFNTGYTQKWILVKCEQKKKKKSMTHYTSNFYNSNKSLSYNKVNTLVLVPMQECPRRCVHPPE